MLQEEKKMRASHKDFGPKNVPRFVHPDDRKRMAAVKSDHKYHNLGEDEPKIKGNGVDSTEEADMPN